MKDDSQQFRGIPIVKSGSKYRTEAGFSAVKDGIKTCRDAPEFTVGGKPKWLRAQLPAGAKFSAVRQTVRDHRLSTVCEESMCPNIDSSHTVLRHRGRTGQEFRPATERGKAR